MGIIRAPAEHTDGAVSAASPAGRAERRSATAHHPDREDNGHRLDALHEGSRNAASRGPACIQSIIALPPLANGSLL